MVKSGTQTLKRPVPPSQIQTRRSKRLNMSSTETKDTSARFTFFYRANSPFSQFHPAVFWEDEIKFLKAEQYMMYHKAKLFGDTEIAEKILKETSPTKIKGLGRKVKGFSEDIWQQNREIIVKKGSMLKFSQNKHLKQVLLETGNTTLVEASPGDRIWGIGMAIGTPGIDDEKNWEGKNLLGKLLTEVREEIKLLEK